MEKKFTTSDYNTSNTLEEIKEEMKTLPTEAELKAKQDKIVKLFLVLHAPNQDGNLRDCQMKILHLLIQQIKVFLQT